MSSRGSPKTCRFCARENAADSKFCSECGAALHLMACPRCGAVNDVKKNFCYQCHHQLSGRTTDDIAPWLTPANDFTPLSPQRSQEERDEAAFFAEIKQLYDGVSQNSTDNFNRPVPGSNVDSPHDVAPLLSAARDSTPSSRQRFQESDEAAFFAEIKQLYDGAAENGTDDLNRPSPSTGVEGSDDVAPRLPADRDFAPSSGQCPQVSDETATRRKIKELYYSNLRRRTPRYGRPLLAAASDRPDELAPRVLIADGDSGFRRRLSQAIIAIAILAAIVVLGYYEFHQRFLGDALRSLVAKVGERGNEGPAGARAVPRGMTTSKTIPTQNTQGTRTEQKTVVWDAQKVNRFWKGLMGTSADAPGNLGPKTPELVAAPAPEPARIATRGPKRSAPTPAKSAAVPASPPTKKATSVPISAFEGELASATAPAIVSFAIAPWGEIYIDGQRRGVNPPMRELELSPGQYEVEVRNTTFPAHVQTIKVEAGSHTKIRHRFR